MKSVRALLVLVIASHGTIAQENRTVALETLRGRPVAEVSSFLFGAILSHKWMSFYFASEEPDGSVRPIQVAYAFYRSDQLPPETFWDYSKLYEIKVRRERGCDTKVKNLAYVENTTVNGKELPRSFVLGFAKGAPQDLLKDEAVLPCYVLWYGDYRQIAAQTIATTIEEPGTIDLESLFQRADSVALANIISGDTEAYDVPIYKAKIVRSFKGGQDGTIYFGPYLGKRLGSDYVSAPNPRTTGVLSDIA